MTRKYGAIVAIMNFMVQKHGAGNFISQIDIGRPDRLGASPYGHWAKGYTDIGRYISCNLSLKGENGKVIEVRVVFNNSENNNYSSAPLELVFGYSEKEGVFEKTVTNKKEG